MNMKLLLTAGLLATLHTTSGLAADLMKGTRAFENQDYETALKELAALSKEGDSDATNMIGQMYENGWAVPQDVSKARALYTQCANIGHLGCVNSLRKLKDKDYQKELLVVQPKADAGDLSAMNRLGQMYEFGYGVKRDPDTALKWYRSAADAGSVAAQYNLGRCYNFGTGVKQDFAEAERWYLKAAEQGHSDALFYIGTLYSNEHGINQEIDTNIQAYAWMHNAAMLGNDTASAIQIRLEMKLNSSELSQAKELSEQINERYIKPYR